MLRSKRIQYLAELAGEEVVRVVDSRDGWPGLIDVLLPSGERVRIEAHVGVIGRTGRGRDAVERRFQNPANKKAMSSPSGAPVVLLGMWESGPRPVLVGMEVEHRIGVSTRQSLFFPVTLLNEVAATGWGERFSSTNEHIIGFIPSLLPIYIESRIAGIRIQPERVASILDASGLQIEDEQLTRVERARRAASRVVRSSTFSKKVIAAYGDRCSLCDLNLELVEGAHIYPASAPGSPDQVWNGIALCCNHHAAFDKHKLWINPETFDVKMRPDLEKRRRDSPRDDPSKLFLDMTKSQMRLPQKTEDIPRPKMFRDRYSLFSKNYSWV